MAMFGQRIEDEIYKTSLYFPVPYLAKEPYGIILSAVALPNRKNQMEQPLWTSICIGTSTNRIFPHDRK